ncbi:protein cbp-1 [Folsomia candida]|uniref:histone acetyltransferase n=1 Tax=Folsomia candida TaxID=158441 RepID=A0A226E3I0_FOLCA|nr:protein cbp-1 [Folsomia candida]OXA51828.1 Protein cbp-1 [Folsomia candida]
MMETILEVPEIGFEITQKIVQQQLVLILHAHACQKQENSYSHDYEVHGQEQPKEKCKLPFCEETKKCLDHIRCCFEPDTCTLTHCHHNREIIRHWKICMKKSSCQICRPVYQAQIHSIKQRRRS